MNDPVNNSEVKPYKKHPLGIAAAIFLMAAAISMLGVSVSALFIPQETYAIGSDLVGGPAGPDCFTIGCGVGGRLVPASPPPFGDGDVLNFGFSCGLIVTIVGPEGNNWGVYQWAVPLPGDNWAESYLTNGYPYTHADEYMLGYAIPTLNPLCPLPMLIEIGTSLLKAGLPGF